ncbi:Uncharacterised protein [Leclercia adecarboxylata]|nr:Uncharacterised protein [Leclercia adecarboxylata]
MPTGKLLASVTPGGSDIFQAVLQIVVGQRGADLRRKRTLLIAPRRGPVMLKGAIHGGLQGAVRQVAGTGFFKAMFDGGFRHQRCALGNLFDALVDLPGIGHFRGADQIQHFCLSLHDVRRDAAGIGDGVVNAGFFNNMFIQEVGAGGHQGNRVQRAASQMRGVGGMGCGAVKTPRRLDIG